MQSTQQALDYDFSPSLNLVKSSIFHLMQRHAEIEQILSGEAQPTRGLPIGVVSRRKCRRMNVKIPLLLLPVQWEEGRLRSLADSPVVGLTRDLSERGLGMTYDARLRSDLVVVEFDLYAEKSLQLLVELCWTRKRGPHDFIGGGQFCGLIKAVH